MKKIEVICVVDVPKKSDNLSNLSPIQCQNEDYPDSFISGSLVTSTNQVGSISLLLYVSTSACYKFFISLFTVFWSAVEIKIKINLNPKITLRRENLYPIC